MTKFDDVEWIMDVSQENHTSRYWDGVCSWAIDTGNISSAANAADNLAENCQETFTHLMQAVTKWNEFREVYGGADQDAVFAAMTPVAEKLQAIKNAGAVFSGAVQVYKASVQDFDDMKVDYDTWAEGWMETYRKVESDHSSLTDEEFMTRYGMSYWEKVDAMRGVRDGKEANGPVWVIDHLNAARRDLASTIDGVDMDALGEMNFSHRTESLTQYETPEELAEALAQSHIFGDADLSEADLLAIAEEVFAQYDDLPFDYVDANGVQWSYGPNGELVRTGSPMDPNLNAAILAVMNENTDWRQVDLSFDGETTQTVAEMASKFGLNSLGKLTESTLGKGVIGGWATAIVQLIGTGVSVNRYGQNLSTAAPLLSESEYQDIVQKYATESLIVDGVQIATGAGSAVLTAVLGPGGTILGIAVTYVATGLTEFIVNEAGDDSWDLDEMQDRYNPETGEFEVD
ncbi:hypothetical protein [Citricoccus sp.]|uniref:hypothetical protein n=1 Tax=Citricoccus sp. TaxID=1978372 RepID=UPI0028BF53AD|nr:hypothetical protein [Citricoccus sp.]